MLYMVMLLPTHTASTVMLAATMVIMPATVPLESVMLMLMLMLHIITLLLLLPTTHPEATTVMLAATTTLESVMLMLMLMLMPTHTASTVMLAATMVIMPATVPLESVMLMLMLMLYIITLLLLLPTLLDMDIDRMATITRDKSEVR